MKKDGEKYICKVCGKEVIHSKKHRNVGNICSSCRQRMYQTNNKKKAVEDLGGKCQICGYNKCIEALDFHHINPKDKTFNIATKMGMSFEKLKPELDKCILLCSNCHRELHYLEKFPNEDYRKNVETMENIHKKHLEKVERYESSKETPQERKNRILSYRKVKRPSTYEQFLKELKELNNNYCAMGRKYGVSDNAIRKWEKSYKKLGY